MFYKCAEQIPHKNKECQVLKPVTKFYLLWKNWIYLPNASCPMTSRLLDILHHRAETASLSLLRKLMSAVCSQTWRASLGLSLNSVWTSVTPTRTDANYVLWLISNIPHPLIESRLAGYQSIAPYQRLTKRTNLAENLPSWRCFRLHAVCLSACPPKLCLSTLNIFLMLLWRLFLEGNNSKIRLPADIKKWLPSFSIYNVGLNLMKIPIK